MRQGAQSIVVTARSVVTGRSRVTAPLGPAGPPPPESGGPAPRARPARICDEPWAQFPPGVTSTLPFSKFAPRRSMSVMPASASTAIVGS